MQQNPQPSTFIDPMLFSVCMFVSFHRAKSPEYISLFWGEYVVLFLNNSDKYK